MRGFGVVLGVAMFLVGCPSVNSVAGAPLTDGLPHAVDAPVSRTVEVARYILQRNVARRGLKIERDEAAAEGCWMFVIWHATEDGGGGDYGSFARFVVAPLGDGTASAIRVVKKGIGARADVSFADELADEVALKVAKMNQRPEGKQEHP